MVIPENIDYILIFVCLVGLCLGSFYNVVICRSLSGENIVFPPSKCPKCNHRLYFWHNIPLISYIILGGRCFFCHEKISLQYPIVEALTVLLFTYTYIKFGFELKTLFVLIVMSCLLIMSATDIKEKLVDCNIAIAVAIIGIIYSFVCSISQGINSILGLIAGVIILESIAWLGKIVFKRRAMGEADTYIAGALGACFGLNSIISILFYSVVSSLFILIPVFMYKQYKQKNMPTLLSTVAFIALSILSFYFQQNIFIIVLMAIIGFVLVISILKNINKNENTYLPFVPALAIGTVYFVFFL